VRGLKTQKESGEVWEEEKTLSPLEGSFLAELGRFHLLHITAKKFKRTDGKGKKEGSRRAKKQSGVSLEPEWWNALATQL